MWFKIDLMSLFFFLFFFSPSSSLLFFLFNFSLSFMISIWLSSCMILSVSFFFPFPCFLTLIYTLWHAQAHTSPCNCLSYRFSFFLSLALSFLSLSTSPSIVSLSFSPSIVSPSFSPSIVSLSSSLSLYRFSFPLSLYRFSFFLSLFLRIITYILPGPLALERAVPKGTIMGETNTAKEPSLFKEAVPTSLIVLRRIFAYSKSTAPTWEKKQAENK